MNWLDICGSPGSGKSTLADPIWPPHAIAIEDRLPPIQWHKFCNEITRLFYLIRRHWSFDAAIRMNNRSVRKIATVARKNDYVWGNPVYIQTALAQRGLGFGWRMNDLGIDLNELRNYFRLMPVSIGVAVTRCPTATVVERNKQREQIKETAHENRGFMVELMAPAIEVALETLRERGVPVLEVDTSGDSDIARQQLVAFAAREPFDASASGPGCKVALFPQPPWWQ